MPSLVPRFFGNQLKLSSATERKPSKYSSPYQQEPNLAVNRYARQIASPCRSVIRIPIVTSRIARLRICTTTASLAARVLISILHITAISHTLGEAPYWDQHDCEHQQNLTKSLHSFRFHFSKRGILNPSSKITLGSRGLPNLS